MPIHIRGEWHLLKQKDATLYVVYSMGLVGQGPTKMA
jgi:hypothetical protein